MFTDICGSTNMMRRLGTAFAGVVEDHNRLIRAAFTAGAEVRSDALRAAVDAQRELAAFSWPEGGTVRVRIGMHSGEGVPGPELAAVKGASTCNGGQIRRLVRSPSIYTMAERRRADRCQQRRLRSQRRR